MSLCLFYKNLTVLDFAYFDADQGVMGESYWVDVRLYGRQNSESMIFDFSEVKKAIKGHIDAICDHRFVVSSDQVEPSSSSQWSFAQNYGEKQKKLVYKAPAEAFFLLPGEGAFSSERLALHLQDHLMPLMPPEVFKLELILRPDLYGDSLATFQYTHGLKQHKGHCQRLFHGHRNPVEVYVEGERQPELEKKLAVKCFHQSVHFIFKDNIADETQTHWVLKYQASQGEFYCEIPKEEAVVFSTETTIENLAQEFYDLLRGDVASEKKMEVYAFEGIGKGAWYTESEGL